jgi:hypothetical protein
VHAQLKQRGAAPHLQEAVDVDIETWVFIILSLWLKRQLK